MKQTIAHFVPHFPCPRCHHPAYWIRQGGPWNWKCSSCGYDLLENLSVVALALVRCRRCKTIKRYGVSFRLQVQYDYDAASSPYPNGEFEKIAPTELCPLCGRTLDIARIQGIYRPDTPCDTRCQEAVGSVCRCSCGGFNHGLKWAEVKP